MSVPTPTGLFTFLSGNFDAALAKFITQASTALSIGIAPIVLIGFTIWIMLYGMASMRGEVQEPFMGFLKMTLRASFIFGLALSAGIYQSMIVDSVYALQTGLVDIFSPGSTSIYAALDKFDDKSTTHAMVIIGRGITDLPMAGWLDFAAGCLLLVSNAALLIMCGGYALMAQVSLTLVLAFGPLFIATLAFPPISNYFQLWLNKIFNYVLMTVYLGAVLTFAITISGDYIDTMIANTDVETVNAMRDAIGLVMVNGALLVVAYQLPQLVAALTGGTPLSGGGLANTVISKLFGGGKSGGAGGGGGGKSESNGGAVSNNSSSSTTNSSSSNASPETSGSGYVPAYQRATRDRLNRQ